jgi:hypothetical protein
MKSRGVMKVETECSGGRNAVDCDVGATGVKICGKIKSQVLLLEPIEIIKVTYRAIRDRTD